MATIPRYQHSLDVLLTSSNLFRNNFARCRKCHNLYQLHFIRSFSSTAKRRESLPFTERLRRRIWKTDNPPGRIDPYSRTSPLRDDVEADEGGQNTRGIKGGRNDEDMLSGPQSNDRMGPLRRQLPMEDIGYVPAETVDGLEWLGSPVWKVRRRKKYKEKVKEASESGMRLPKHEDTQFTWAKPEENATPEAILKALHRAIVEVFTFLSAGQSPLCAVTSEGKRSVDWTVAVRIDPSEDKNHAVLTFPNVDVRDRILKVKKSQGEEETKQDNEAKVSPDGLAASPAEVAEDVQGEVKEELEAKADAAADAADTEIYSISESERSETIAEDGIAGMKELEDDADAISAPDEIAQTQPENQPITQASQQIVQKVNWGKDWRFISIRDPLIKFALIKRLIQITGLRITDQHIRQCDTVNDLYHGMKDIIKEKPKLATLLLESKKAELAMLPNLTVSEKKISRVDKDKQTGKYGIITKELKRRGLLGLKKPGFY